MKLSLVPGILCALLATIAPVVSANENFIDMASFIAAGERGELATELPEGYVQLAADNDQPSYGAPPPKQGKYDAPPPKQARDGAPPPKQGRYGAGAAPEPPLPGFEGATQLRFQVDYLIKEFPEVGPTDVAELERETEYTFLFEIMSDEVNPLSIVGLGGRFLNASTKEVIVNITADAIGPVAVQQGGTENFERKITMLLPDGNYIFVPEIYLVMNEEVRVAPLRNQLLTLETPPVSFFSVPFIFTSLVLLASIGVIGYSMYLGFVKPYFQKTSPADFKKRSKAQGTTSGAEWLPKGVQVPRSKKSA